jgi:hypothetical protein
MRRTREDFYEELRLGLDTLGKTVTGEVVLAPTAVQMTGVISTSKGMLYNFGTDYRTKLEEVSGMTVVHEGPVLAILSDVDGAASLNSMPEAPKPDDTPPLERAIEATQNLSIQERMQLIAHLALTTPDAT